MSSNEHGFFVDVTSGGKIGEGRIRDLTGDILFPVAFKDTIPTTIPTVTMINSGQCWCVMSNKALTDISRARTSWLVEIFCHEPREDAED